jgi:hypothetical protein
MQFPPLLANDIGAAFWPDPNLVAHSCGHIQSLTDTICSLCCGIGGIWVGNRQLATQNEVGGEAGVVVWAVVGVSKRSVSLLDEAEWVDRQGKHSRPIRPGKDVAKAPGAHFSLAVFGSLGHGCNVWVAKQMFPFMKCVPEAVNALRRL